MKLPKFLMAIFILALPAFAARGNPTIVRGWEGTIDLTTYALGEEDPNPPFPLVNRHQIYPYTMLDDLTDKREVRTYRAIYLENQFLKAIILPELGGRLYSLYDKVSKREVFYRNNMVKYGLVSLRGAWISGGIEFNFPNGHTVVTVSHVASRLLANADGSTTAVVGGMDWVTGMHWEVALTLRPNQARLEQHVTLFNSTPVENLYWYWANAAVPATEDMQFIYPMREVNPHSRSEIWTYPVWKGVDYSWYKNIRQPTSLFGRGIQRNFFGAYYHDSDYGVIHTANFSDVPGKKIWSWGVGGDGLIWTDLLTDKDGAYNEIQSGRYETQLNQEFLSPQKIESWSEYWYPVRKLGDGFVEATNELAMNVKYLPSSGVAPLRVELTFNPTVDLQGAKINVSVGGVPAHDLGAVNFKAATVQSFYIPVASIEAARKSLIVDVVDADSHQLLHWSAADPVDGNKKFVAAAGAHEPKEKSLESVTVGELYLRGIDQEKDGDSIGAAKTYQDVLQRKPNYVPALLKLAYRDCAAGDLDAAQQKIDRALAENSNDPGVLYAAGVLHRAAGHWEEPKRTFSATLKANGPRVPALIQLGEISTHEKQYGQAISQFQQALGSSPDNALAFADLAVALRLAGKITEARKAAEQALKSMPLLPFALVEKWRCQTTAEIGKPVNDGSAKSWKLIFNFDAENYLEVASRYRELGDVDSSNAVLEVAFMDFQAQKISPLVYYYLAANARKVGNLDRAAELAAKAASASFDKVFPQRLSDFQVLREALSHNPKDAHAHYFLGTFLFAHDRYEDAAKEWLAARANGFDDPVLERNLGVYEWQVKKDLPKAAEYYEKAIQLAPSQYRYYSELDEIYTQLGATEKRTQLFSRAPAEVLDRDTVRVRRALLDIQLGKFSDALALLNDHHYKPWEGGAVVRQIFVLANLTHGKALLAANKPLDASSAFRRALDYPNNLGVGKPDKPHDEPAWYWLGIALAAGGKSAEAKDAWQTAVNEGQTAGGVSRAFAAGAMIKLGQRESGEKLLADASEPRNQPDADAHSLYIAGLAEQLLNHDSEARDNFRRAVELDPLFWQARFELDQITGAAK